MEGFRRSATSPHGILLRIVPFLWDETLDLRNASLWCLADHLPRASARAKTEMRAAADAVPEYARTAQLAKFLEILDHPDRLWEFLLPSGGDD